MNIQAVDKTFVQFLSPSDQIIYTIPSYQREYSWTKDYCEELYNDIDENDPGYFIGSIIWIESTKDIIDGQQRLTSLNLLLIAIYCRLLEFLNTEELTNIKIDLKRMIVSNKTSRLVPQHQGKNKRDFEYLVKKYVLNESITEPTHFKRRKVRNNYEFFCAKVKELDAKRIVILFKKICSLTFISAKVGDPQTAFTLFETMNNRGMDLSAIDLIKNSYMNYMNINKNDGGKAISNWTKLIDILGSEYNQEQFLRNNYNAFRKEYNDIPGLVTEETRYEIANKATRSNVIRIYNKLIHKNNFMDFITTNAEYNAFLTGEENLHSECPEEYKNIFKNFRNANATSSFMLLLFLLRNEIPFGFKEEQMCSLFDLILKFFIRRNLTNNPSTGALPQIMMDIISDINGINNPSYDNVYNIILNKFISKTSSDSSILEVLKGDIYDKNRDMARYLLSSLCEKRDNNEKRYIDLWARNGDGKYIWTIEHILPEGNRHATNTPKCWIQMIRDGDLEYINYEENKIIDLIKQYRHKLGNLTMTGFNSSLGNSSFDEKKNRFSDNHDPIGYNNGLSLNDYVYEQNRWTISNIIERTEALSENIMNMLKLN